MSNEELLRMYFKRIDQRQDSFRQEQVAQQQDVVAQRQAVTTIESRMDRMVDMMQSMLQALKEQKRFIAGVIVAAVGTTAAIVSLMIAFV